MLKNLFFSSLVGLVLVAFTGCTNSSDTAASKCGDGKCDSAKTVEKKCDGAKTTDAKCGQGKCGSN